MARIRSIKPEFFTSEDIVSLTPLARLFYVSLWCEADREGRLSWKPRTLKMRYLPADDCSVEDLAEELVDAGLVVLYEVDGRSLACIPGFKRHQIINNKESESVLPSPDQCEISAAPKRTKPALVDSKTHDLMQQNPNLMQESHDQCASSAALPRVKDACKTRLVVSQGKEGKEGKEGIPTRGSSAASFNAFWTTYPKKTNKGQAEKAFAKLNPDERLLATLLAAVQRAKTREQWQKDGGQFIPYPATWLNARGWEDEEAAPSSVAANSLFAGVL